MDIESLSAHIEIRQALARYCRGADRGDRALIASAYHDDAEVRYGEFRGTALELAERIVGRTEHLPIVGQHHVTNVYAEVGEGRAHVESYFIVLRPAADQASGASVLIPLGGRYLDQFERRDGEWKIAAREVVVDWMDDPMTKTLMEAEVSYRRGGRGAGDPAHDFFRPPSSGR